jgi:hypothetical protein
VKQGPWTLALQREARSTALGTLKGYRLPREDCEELADIALMRLIRDCPDPGLIHVPTKAHWYATNIGKEHTKKRGRRAEAETKRAASQSLGDLAEAMGVAAALAPKERAEHGLDAAEPEQEDPTAPDHAAHLELAARNAAYIAGALVEHAQSWREWAAAVRELGALPGDEMLADLEWFARVQRAFSGQPEPHARGVVAVGVAIHRALWRQVRGKWQSTVPRGIPKTEIERWLRAALAVDVPEFKIAGSLRRADLAGLVWLASNAPKRGKRAKGDDAPAYYERLGQLAAALCGQEPAKNLAADIRRAIRTRIASK